MDNADTMAKLNALKHHFHFLQTQMKRWVAMEWEEVIKEIQELGENQFDIYTGNLTVEQILHETGELLHAHGITNREELHFWLGRNSYRSLYLSDGSEWVVRESDSPLTPAHLHPARNQPLAVRIKAAHVRTVLAVLHRYRGVCPPVEILSTSEMNNIRQNMALLSPIRSLQESQRILKVLEFISSGIKNSSSGS